MRKKILNYLVLTILSSTLSLHSFAVVDDARLNTLTKSVEKAGKGNCSSTVRNAAAALGNLIMQMQEESLTADPRYARASQAINTYTRHCPSALQTAINALYDYSKARGNGNSGFKGKTSISILKAVNLTHKNLRRNLRWLVRQLNKEGGSEAATEIAVRLVRESKVNSIEKVYPFLNLRHSEHRSNRVLNSHVVGSDVPRGALAVGYTAINKNRIFQ